MMTCSQKMRSEPLNAEEQNVFMRLLLRLIENASTQIVKRNAKSLFTLLNREHYR